MKPLLSLGRDKRGAVAIEFALILPLFVAFSLALLDLGHIYLIRSSMDYALSEAGRYALVHTDATDAQLVTQVQGAFHVGAAADLQVTSAVQTVSSKNYRVISAVYPVNTLAGGFISHSTIILNRTVSIPVYP